MTEDGIIAEIKKLKRNYSDVQVIEFIEGMSKKVEKAFVLKNGTNFRVVLIKAKGKIYAEFFNLKDLSKKWINKENINFSLLIKESISYLNNGTPQQRKYFQTQGIDSTFRSVPDKDMGEYLKYILP